MKGTIYCQKVSMFNLSRASDWSKRPLEKDFRLAVPDDDIVRAQFMQERLDLLLEKGSIDDAFYRKHYFDKEYLTNPHLFVNQKLFEWLEENLGFFYAHDAITVFDLPKRGRRLNDIERYVQDWTPNDIIVGWNMNKSIHSVYVKIDSGAKKGEEPFKNIDETAYVVVPEDKGIRLSFVEKHLDTHEKEGIISPEKHKKLLETPEYMTSKSTFIVHSVQNEYEKQLGVQNYHNAFRYSQLPNQVNIPDGETLDGIVINLEREGRIIYERQTI